MITYILVFIPTNVYKIRKTFFCLSNGVKQGEILSPTLLNI